MNNKKETSGARFLSAVWLIREVTRGDLLRGEMREAALHSYEVVLGVLESGDLAESISVFGKIPLQNIRPAAKKIVEFLLFDGKSNPFVSLGLSPFATREDIHHRWKRLIAIYHPDRHPGEKDQPGEEAAKKINEAYRRAIDIKALKPNRVLVFREKQKDRRHRTDNRKEKDIRLPARGILKNFFRHRLSSILFLAGVIVMISALISIFARAGSFSFPGLKKGPVIKEGAMPGARAGKIFPQPVMNSKTGDGVNGPDFENNAPEKTYLLLPLKNGTGVRPDAGIMVKNGAR
ncbi:MAG: J domain-containing protein [Nitrospiraceae bacterium]|nr:J domain-containing protein [Nitrospiraceae bacterium]